MKIMDFVKKKAVTVNLKANDKEGVIRELVELIVKTGEVKPKDSEGLVKVLLERELLGSTGIGQGIGIPHGKSPKIRDLIGAVGISKEGINFDSLDGEPTYIFFLLLAPQESAGPHLKALARISRLLKDRYFQEMLNTAKTEKELINFIVREDQKKQ